MRYTIIKTEGTRHVVKYTLYMLLQTVTQHKQLTFKLYWTEQWQMLCTFHSDVFISFYLILTNTNNAPPEFGAVEILCAVPANSSASHLILWSFYNNIQRSDWHKVFCVKRENRQKSGTSRNPNSHIGNIVCTHRWTSVWHLYPIKQMNTRIPFCGLYYSWHVCLKHSYSGLSMSIFKQSHD